MSKSNNTNAFPDASYKIRIESLSQLKRDFRKELPKSEEYYDRRVYYDGTDEYYPYIFSKCLPHNEVTGFVKKEDAEKLINGWKIGDQESINSIVLATGATRKLEGVAASLSFQMMGTDSTVYAIKNIFSVDSDEAAFEQAEVYARSVARDIPFSQYSVDSKIGDLVLALNEYSEVSNTAHYPVNVSNIFRGTLPGDLIGPYISQFLIQDFSYSNIQVVQKFESENDHVLSKTWTNFIDVQNGKVTGSIQKTNAKYCYNGRVLGSKVHNDPLFAFYYNAAMICLQNGYKPSGFDHINTSDWTSGGGPSVFASLAHVALGALRMAWNSKFGQAMRIRPEVYAGRLEYASSITSEERNRIPGLSKIYNKLKPLIKNEVLNQDSVSTLLLLNQYPEGSPTHPSLPAGHAVVAGACVTVLKAMLDLHDTSGNARSWSPNPAYEASQDGESRVLYTGGNLTVIGELNKLASNVSYGRDFAGVHVRIDGKSGINLGEQYAISYLQDVAKEYHESKSGLFNGWLLEKFDGSKVNITSSGVTPV